MKYQHTEKHCFGTSPKFSHVYFNFCNSTIVHVLFVYYYLYNIHTLLCVQKFAIIVYLNNDVSKLPKTC